MVIQSRKESLLKSPLNREIAPADSASTKRATWGGGRASSGVASDSPGAIRMAGLETHVPRGPAGWSAGPGGDPLEDSKHSSDPCIARHVPGEGAKTTRASGQPSEPQFRLLATEHGGPPAPGREELATRQPLPMHRPPRWQSQPELLPEGPRPGPRPLQSRPS